MIGGALGIFAYVAGNAVYAKYLLFPYIPGASELSVVCGALVGAGLGFLWFNAYPAEVFMGDVGALALGAALGTIAVISRQEIVLFIMGGVFVAETLSVMLQVIYFKLTGGKRIFRMAPLHHHYELGGWKETQVVVRFWIITVVLVLFGLSTLKLRCRMDLTGRKVLVLGLGETGLSMARWIARRGGTVRVADTRAAPPALAALRTALPQAQVTTGPFTRGASRRRRSRGGEPRRAARGAGRGEAALARGLEVVGDVELFARFLAEQGSAQGAARVIAITGTNGKSTVTALAGAMCRAAGVDCEVAGNISPAVLTALATRLDSGRLPEAWVVELSSFQLETTTSLRSSAATVLNVSRRPPRPISRHRRRTPRRRRGSSPAAACRC